MSEQTPTPHKKSFRKRAAEFASNWSIESHDGYKLTKGENFVARSLGRTVMLLNGRAADDDKNNPVTRIYAERAAQREQLRTTGTERKMTKSEMLLGGLYEIGTLTPVRGMAAMAASSILSRIHEKKAGGLGKVGSTLRDAADKHIILQNNTLHNPWLAPSGGYSRREAREFADQELAKKRAGESDEEVQASVASSKRYDPFAD